jgi:purine operon repressor
VPRGSGEARAERLVAVTRRLLEEPGRMHSLPSLGVETGVAKSTLSEDLDLIDRVLRREGSGAIETVVGAAGGVRWAPVLRREEIEADVEELLVEFKRPDRVVADNFLYMTDVIFSPRWSARIGRIFAALFYRKAPSVVVTVETKGIPIALMTAFHLGVPLAVARRESRVTEGPSLSFTYVSGSSQRISSMYLPRRALPARGRAVIVDDFLKGGGTAKALSDMIREFGVEVAAVGVLMDTAKPEEKLAPDYVALLRLEHVTRQGVEVTVAPSLARHTEVDPS